MLTEPGGTLGQALDYARRGWPVFPCRDGSKEPATRHGFKDATTDPGTIRGLVASPARRQRGRRDRLAGPGRPRRRPPRSGR